MLNIEHLKNKEIVVDDDGLLLKVLRPDDVTDRYVEWLNNYEVVKYTEQRFSQHRVADVVDFVHSRFSSPSDLLFGIYSENRHIGNIKLGPMNFHHGFSDISFFIGEKNFWGRGLTTKVVGAVVKLAFEEAGLDKVTSGCYANNIGSINVLKKNGFFDEARRLKQVVYEGERIDFRFFGKLRDEPF